MDAFSMPPAVSEMLSQYVVQPIKHPKLYGKDSFVPRPRHLSVFGRKGNHMKRAISEYLMDQEIWAKSVDLAKCTSADSLFRGIQVKKSIKVLLVSHAELLDQSPNPGDLPAMLEAIDDEFPNDLIVLFLFSCALSELSERTRQRLCTYCTYYPPPDLEWRTAYLKHLFSAYQAWVQSHPQLSHISVAMSLEDLEFLGGAAAFYTPTQLRKWAENVFLHAHRLGVPPFSLDLDYVKRNRLMVCVAGIEWSLTASDGAKLEQRFSVDAGCGMLPVRDEKAMEDAKRKRQAEPIHSIGDRGPEEEAPSREGLDQGKRTRFEINEQGQEVEVAPALGEGSHELNHVDAAIEAASKSHGGRLPWELPEEKVSL